MKRLTLACLAVLMAFCAGCAAKQEPQPTETADAPAVSTESAQSAASTEPVQASDPDGNPIDGTYIYAPSNGGGVYVEYVIDSKDNSLTLNEVNIFDDAYRRDAVEVETLTRDGEDYAFENLIFTAGSDGSLVVNHGVAELKRVIEIQEEMKVSKNPVATITMADGKTMTVELYPNVAPNTVRNFISLANSGFYDGLTFHRIISGFMIQGGCPLGTGTGDPGYSIKGEFAANGFVQNNLSHKRGVISMARATPYDSAGSQFFIMHADYPYLNAQYAGFGMLTDGFDVLDAIAASDTNANDAPLTPVVMQSVRVETFGVDYGEPETIR